MKSNGIRKSRKRMSQLRGKLRQKIKNGPYYYRLMVANGTRKEFALKTCDFEEACRKAADMDAVWDAPNKEVAIAQITAMKGFSKKAMNLPLSRVFRRWRVSSPGLIGDPVEIGIHFALSHDLFPCDEFDLL